MYISITKYISIWNKIIFASNSTCELKIRNKDKKIKN